jgi:hypothetical protein
MDPWRAQFRIDPFLVLLKSEVTVVQHFSRRDLFGQQAEYPGGLQNY